MWFVRSDGDGVQCLALIPAERGFAVVHSPTGNYLSGHGEGVLQKRVELSWDGFRELAVAREEGLVPPDWQPPLLSLADHDFLALVWVPLPVEHVDAGYVRPSRPAAGLRTLLRGIFRR